MECSCTAGGDYENDDCIGYHEKKIKAAKGHICPECGVAINKGDEFVFCSIMMFENISNHKMCLDCHDITNKFFSDGFRFGSILEDLYLYFDSSWLDDLPSSCISKLRPRSRDMVCDILQKFQDVEEITA